MPRTPYFENNLPNDSETLSAEEERSERLLRQVKRENMEFYSENVAISRNISNLQMGVHQAVLNTLDAGANFDRIKSERVRNLLYRSIKGQYQYETEFGDDELNRINSISANYLGSGFLGKANLWTRRALRGISSFAGLNNHVESEIVNRFGRDQDIQHQREFVIGRLEPVLNGLTNDQRNAIRIRLGLAVTVTGLPIVDITDELNVSSYYRLNSVLAPNPNLPANALPNDDLRITLNANEGVFGDLLLLSYAIEEASNETGKEAVNDFQQLRNWWEGLRAFGEGSAEHDLYTAVNNILEANSLNPLENNPEAKALLAELRVRHRNQGKNGYISLVEEIENIQENESPTRILEDNERENLNNFRNTSENDINGLINQLGNLEALNNIIGVLDNNITQIIGSPAIPARGRHPAVAAVVGHIEDVRNEITNLETQRNTLITAGASHQLINSVNTSIRDKNNELSGLEQRLENLRQQRDTRNTERDNLIDTIKNNAKALNQSIIQSGYNEHFPANTLRALPASLNIPNNTRINIFNYIGLRNNDFIRGNINGIINNLNSAKSFVRFNLENAVAGNRAHMTPFVLLQRLMRRDYSYYQGLPNDPDNEEANHYANLKAALRVEDVKNVDRKRSANQQAINYQNRRVIGKPWSKFYFNKPFSFIRRNFKKLQDVVGIEVFEFETFTSDQILREIINSDSKFAVFRGINKYKTTRDIRAILNKTGKQVSSETIDRFAATLEEAINEYKKVHKDLNQKLSPDDWDLENTVSALKELKLELWSRDFLGKVRENKEANRGRALVRMLNGSRIEEQKISIDIAKGVKSPDAIWRKFLFKSKLKEILKDKNYENWNLIKQNNILSLESRRDSLIAERDGLPDGDARKLRLNNDLENINSEINVIRGQLSQAQDLHDRVMKAREFLRENKLSRKERKDYLEREGLTGVFDKFSQNFRAENAWNKTKEVSKKSWSWSRENFLNADSARSGAKKTASLARIAVTPVTAPVSLAWRAGTWPLKIAGRGVRTVFGLPRTMFSFISPKLRRKYLREKIISLNNQIADIEKKQVKLTEKMGIVPYGWDRRRLMKKFEKLEIEKSDKKDDIAQFTKIAGEEKIDISNLPQLATAA